MPHFGPLLDRANVEAKLRTQWELRTDALMRDDSRAAARADAEMEALLAVLFEHMKQRQP